MSQLMEFMGFRWPPVSQYCHGFNNFRISLKDSSSYCLCHSLTSSDSEQKSSYIFIQNNQVPWLLWLHWRATTCNLVIVSKKIFTSWNMWTLWVHFDLPCLENGNYQRVTARIACCYDCQNTRTGPSTSAFADIIMCRKLNILAFG